MPPKNLLSTEDVARRAGCSVDYVRKARRRGIMPEATFIGGMWVWTEDDIDAWIESKPSRGRPRSEPVAYSPPEGQPWVIGVMPGKPRSFHVVIANGPHYKTLCYLRGPFGGTKEGPNLETLENTVTWPMCKACAKRLRR